MARVLLPQGALQADAQYHGGIPQQGFGDQWGGGDYYDYFQVTAPACYVTQSYVDDLVSVPFAPTHADPENSLTAGASRITMINMPPTTSPTTRQQPRPHPKRHSAPTDPLPTSTTATGTLLFSFLNSTRTYAQAKRTAQQSHDLDQATCVPSLHKRMQRDCQVWVLSLCATVLTCEDVSW